ncbi:hypothetical protein [Jeotgalicoccus sp. FSL K6-3177]|uniref:hypothetical protein n=1 Tax=Jeotgalicoccus sp. FSL K6-3177 TaxID=2921494 RepID=UPI0030FD81E5
MKNKSLINPKRLIKNNLHKLYSKKVEIFYNLSSDEILDYRNKRFKDILEHSLKYVPYYNQPIYHEFYNSFEKTHFNHLNELPILKKQDVKDFNDKFWSSKKFKIRTVHTTSGTSGKTIKMNTFLEEKLFQLSTLNTWYKKIGIETGWKIYLSGFMTPNNNSDDKFWIDKLDKSIYLSIYDINKKNISLYEKLFSQYNPKLIYGYPSTVYEFSKVITESISIIKILRYTNLKVVTTSEVLQPGWADFILNNVGDIYNLYGSQEGAHFATTFKDGYIYNHPYYGVIETVDDNNRIIEGSLGNVIVTGLNKKSMPLIRYDIGDTATIEKMTDGWDKIHEIGGRSEDLIKKKDGSKVSLLNFHASKNINEINLSQIIQYSYDRFLVNINYIENTNESLKHQVNEKFASAMKNRLGNKNLDIKFKEMEEFSKGPNGKFKSVIVKEF